MDVLQQLREKGNSRRDRWHTPDTEPWTGADWSNAMCGEAGEAANVVKKIRRIETGTGSQSDPPLEELLMMLGKELADTIAYADLLAQHYDIDLRAMIAVKFNEVSEREGFPERINLVDGHDPAACPLPETRCLDARPHAPHDWASLSHRWCCPGRTGAATTA